MKPLSCLTALALLLLCVALPIAAQDDPAADDAPAADQPAEETPAEEAPAEEAPAEEAAEETPAEETPAEETPAEEAPAEAEVKVILSNLYNPSGVAVQPETGRIFISDSGANRVVSFDPADQNPVRVDVKGDSAAIDIYGKGPKYDIGPLGLVFLDQNTLVVGGGDKVDGQEVMRIFDLSTEEAAEEQAAEEPATEEPASDEPAVMPQTYEQAAHTLGPIAAGDTSAMGEGNFYGLAASKTAVYITSNGDDTKGWVLRIPLADGQPGALETFIATKVELEDVDAPVGIALNRDGHIVVGQMGEVNVPADSLYTVYDPETGELKARAETGLNDIAGLAYSPTSGKLYAVDFSWVDPTQGGLFRLDINEDDSTVTSVKICSLDKPSTLAFTPDGACYVTVFGTAEEGADPKKRPGKLVRIMAEL